MYLSNIYFTYAVDKWCTVFNIIPLFLSSAEFAASLFTSQVNVSSTGKYVLITRIT